MNYKFAFQFENVDYRQATNIKEFDFNQISPPVSNYFPMRFYPSSVSGLVGIKKDANGYITLIKYFMTSIEAINKVKEMDAQLLGDLIKFEHQAFLFDSIKGEFVTASSFSSPFPPKFQSVVYGYSDGYKQIFSIKGDDVMGILAAFYMASVYLKNPGYKGFSSAAKKFIYNWTCLTFGYKISNKIDICSLEWPSNGLKREVSLPEQKFLKELGKMSSKIILKMPKQKVKESSVEGEETISLLRMINTGAVLQKKDIDNSDKIVIIIDIDAPNFEFITSAYIKDGLLNVYYDRYGGKFLHSFYEAIGWKGSVNIVKVESEEKRGGNAAIGQYDFNAM